ncbi:hypothetical protein C4E15_22355 [Achromobacter spanius]|uniref:Uncharacterized protein n=1 Tax=Achromobacter spanius TaxID=217203 RepID=A0A2S5GM10_9BURK|nr:hypothetical protein [Achromobacter spanius]PPA74100.1 hypothetical protein C4E15_22355 [Achromobacter spanius]
MTATPPDPFATQHDSTTDPDATAPVDAQTRRLREENRALRELLAAQVQAAMPQPQPSCLRRIGWALISAPGAALVGWRALLGRDEGQPMTGRRVGSATLTVLYTLAIYGALVLLVVSWNAPNNGITGARSASPVRVPLAPLPALPTEEVPSEWETTKPEAGVSVDAPQTAAPAQSAQAASAPVPSATSSPDAASDADASAASGAPVAAGTSDAAGAGNTAAPATAAPTAPRSTLRITEIPARNPMAWVDALDRELARCAELGFFERPECAWAARKQYCEPNQGWGAVRECPAQP